jgi:D-aminopeptidase
MLRGPMPRLRDLGFTVGVLPSGPLDAITDVPGVRVGHATVRREDGRAPWRTGVTAIWPHEGEPWRERVRAGTSVLNGLGEMTARAVVDEWGLLETPILLTGTAHVGIVYHWTLQRLLALGATSAGLGPPIPMVAECDDGVLDGSAGLAIGREAVWAALDGARGGALEVGCVGAGTGTQLFGWKGGLGSASRVVSVEGRAWTVGALTLTNFGHPEELRFDGRPVGRVLRPPADPRPAPQGSCIVVLATDAPLSSRQCARLATRAALGLARTGATAHDASGDLAVAFSTAERVPFSGVEATARALVEGWASPLTAVFKAAVEATEASVLDALVAAETTTGVDGRTLHALPLERLRALVAPWPSA